MFHIYIYIKWALSKNFFAHLSICFQVISVNRNKTKGEKAKQKGKKDCDLTYGSFSTLV